MLAVQNTGLRAQALVEECLLGIRCQACSCWGSGIGVRGFSMKAFQGVDLSGIWV